MREALWEAGLLSRAEIEASRRDRYLPAHPFRGAPLTDQAPEPRQPHMVDRHVGARVRVRRKAIGISQERLADALGLTFQQVQKYERGSNRISASKLFQIATFLGAPVSYFFDGLGDPAADPGSDAEAGRAVHEFLMTAEGMELAKAFPLIRNRRVRRRILDLVRALAGDDDSPSSSIGADKAERS